MISLKFDNTVLTPSCTFSQNFVSLVQFSFFSFLFIYVLPLVLVFNIY